MTSDDSLQPPAASGGVRRLLQLSVPLVGAVLLIAGTVLLVRGAGVGTVNFGFVGYIPVTEADGVFDGLVLVSRSMQVGALLVLAGAVVLAFWAGLQAGRRRRPPVTPASAASGGDGQPA
ncbi:hypothetical protein [Arthrobacter gengyunqii]|uniref:Uncharacterized protein n=1 Tax=Arthrobacter gengyunqii TaxID=2886940 RepID=A0ABS8GIJ7_9MICC|nr:hypothetical protein [Arthrobacter gengyunqii]MCC3266482.1 hypothetical protein [Arthrobacter gengyunqii]